MKLSISSPVAVGDLHWDDDDRAAPNVSRADMAHERNLARDHLRAAKTEPTRARNRIRLEKARAMLHAYDERRRRAER